MDKDHNALRNSIRANGVLCLLIANGELPAAAGPDGKFNTPIVEERIKQVVRLERSVSSSAAAIVTQIDAEQWGGEEE